MVTTRPLPTKPIVGTVLGYIPGTRSNSAVSSRTSRMDFCVECNAGALQGLLSAKIFVGVTKSNQTIDTHQMRMEENTKCREILEAHENTQFGVATERTERKNWTKANDVIF